MGTINNKIYNDARRELMANHPQDYKRARGRWKAEGYTENHIRRLWKLRHYEEYREIVDRLRGPRKPSRPGLSIEQIADRPLEAQMKVLYSRARGETHAHFLKKYPSEYFHQRAVVRKRFPRLNENQRAAMVEETIRQAHLQEFELYFQTAYENHKHELYAERTRRATLSREG